MALLKEFLYDPIIVILGASGILASLIPYIFFTVGVNKIQNTNNSEIQRLADNVTTTYITGIFRPIETSNLRDFLSMMKSKIMTNENLKKVDADNITNNSDIVSSLSNNILIIAGVFLSIAFIIHKFTKKSSLSELCIRISTICMGAIIAELLFIGYVVGDYKSLDMSALNTAIVEYGTKKSQQVPPPPPPPETSTPRPGPRPTLQQQPLPSYLT